MDYVRGALALRAADGFARNALLANQVELFTRYGGLGNNGAQQASKWLSAVSSVMPLALGFCAARLKWPLRSFVLFGCCLEIAGISLVAESAALGGGHILSRPLLMLGLFGPFAVGFGAVTSSLPVLATERLIETARGKFMQVFFAFLAAGGMAGILAAAMWQAWRLEPVGLAFAALILICGTIALALDFNPCCEYSRKDDNNDESEVEVAIVSESRREEHEESFTLQQLMPLLLLIPFYGAYLQWTTSWYVQTQYLNRQLWRWEVPVCLMQFVERVGCLIALLALRRLWELSRFEQEGFFSAVASFHSSQPPLPATARLLRTRLSMGCVMAALAMTASAAVEVTRRDWTPRLPGEPQISSLSIVWQTPQFVLIAISEALLFPAQTEWASGSPTLVGLGCAVQALAAALLSLIVRNLQVWIPEGSPNEGRYDLYFMVLAVSCVLSACAFFLLPPSSWVPRPKQKESGPEIAKSSESSRGSGVPMYSELHG